MWRICPAEGVDSSCWVSEAFSAPSVMQILSGRITIVQDCWDIFFRFLMCHLILFLLFFKSHINPAFFCKENNRKPSQMSSAALWLNMLLWPAGGPALPFSKQKQQASRPRSEKSVSCTQVLGTKRFHFSSLIKSANFTFAVPHRNSCSNSSNLGNGWVEQIYIKRELSHLWNY